MKTIETKPMYKFIQTLDSKSAVEQCMLNYVKYGGNNTINTTGVPFTTIGKIGSYNVQVRYYRMFNQKPEWGFALEATGSFHSEGRFNSFQEALDACIAIANDKEKMVGKLPVYNSSRSPYNFPENLLALFDAMVQGKTIKSVTCFGGHAFKEDKEKDFTIENFIATEYNVAATENRGQKNDYVDTDKRPFYMDWVKSFVIE